MHFYRIFSVINSTFALIDFNKTGTRYHIGNQIDLGSFFETICSQFFNIRFDTLQYYNRHLDVIFSYRLLQSDKVLLFC